MTILTLGSGFGISKHPGMLARAAHVSRLIMPMLLAKAYAILWRELQMPSQALERPSMDTHCGSPCCLCAKSSLCKSSKYRSGFRDSKIRRREKERDSKDSKGDSKTRRRERKKKRRNLKSNGQQRQAA